MPTSIPRELIDQLSTRVIVAGRANRGKTHLLKVLANELQRKHTLPLCVHLTEFYSESGNGYGELLNAEAASNALYICDTPQPHVPSVCYAVELYSAQLSGPVGLGEADTTKALHPHAYTRWPTDSTVVVIVDTEWCEGALRLEVEVYTSRDLESGCLGRHVVHIDLPTLT